MHYKTKLINSLKIMHCITNKSGTVELSLFIKKEKNDIVMLNETYLKPKHKFYLPGYMYSI